jgi:uncharacterized protein
MADSLQGSVMRVELSSLEGKSGKFAHDYQPGELILLDERVVLAQPPHVAGRILRKGPQLFVQGELTAVAQVECDRCLRLITFPVTQEFSLEYVTTDEYKSLKAAELSEEDLALSVFDGEGIDIDEIVREQLLLAVPFHTLCRENCKGLCTVCGGDKNLTECSCTGTEIDPRWKGLEKLVNRKS